MPGFKSVDGVQGIPAEDTGNASDLPEERPWRPRGCRAGRRHRKHRLVMLLFLCYFAWLRSNSFTMHQLLDTAAEEAT